MAGVFVPVSWIHSTKLTQKKAEKLIAATGAVIKHEKSEEAYYSPKKDEIHLPLKEQFLSSEHYYDTLLHETGHWTGHPSRLNRPMRGVFGSEEYAKEELRAEIASAMLSSTLGIPHDIGNHVSYVKSWIKVLEDDPKEIFRAAADADKIKDFIISKDKELMEELYGKTEETKSKGSEEKTQQEKALKAYVDLSEEEKKEIRGMISRLVAIPRTNPYLLTAPKEKLLIAKRTGLER